MRKIGQRIRQVCEVLERIGPCTSLTVFKQLDGVEHSNAYKYCHRAATLQLALTVREGGVVRFAVHPDWRQRIKKHDERNTVKNRNKHTKQPIVNNKKPIVNSVWSLAL